MFYHPEEKAYKVDKNEYKRSDAKIKTDVLIRKRVVHYAFSIQLIRYLFKNIFDFNGNPRLVYVNMKSNMIFTCSKLLDLSGSPESKIVN